MTISLLIIALLWIHLLYKRRLAIQQKQTTQITAELIRLDIEETGKFRIQGRDWVHYEYTLTDKKILPPTF